jgi:hypothetical protein
MIQYLIEKGADLNANNDMLLKWSVENTDLDFILELIIEKNMPVKEKTLQWLKKNKYFDVVNIIKSRDLNNKLDGDLDKDITETKQIRMKI